MRIGIDLGSTTAKMVITDEGNRILFNDYRRHNARVARTLKDMLRESRERVESGKVSVAVTGSAGLGFSERYNIPFVQEVIASAETVRRIYPDVRTLIDVGGEDSKMIFFDERMRVDIRMNGNCAGGTGAFIDQMATLLDIDMSHLESYSRRSRDIYPIASRCGVFAKTDVQNLLARKISKEDIVASIFHAVALQTTSTLSRGYDSKPKVLFCGGPFTFLPSLRDHFMDVLDVSPDDTVTPEDPELVPSIGTALYDDMERMETTLDGLLELLDRPLKGSTLDSGRLDPLFENEKEFRQWSSHRMTPIGRTSSFGDLGSARTYLGIDSGSTTTKIVLIDENANIVFHDYRSNNGDPIGAVKDGLEELSGKAKDEGVRLNLASTSVTGYGEDLIKAAYGMDRGMVETLAHFRAASEFLPDASFILDIGGQDMKAMFINNGIINDIEINEACSSGCGSFLETFARTLGMGVEDFALKACHADSPYDLGTRCTVFMNSRVKQALREGATVGDISAGLAFSVVKNCLYKVLKIKDTEILGDSIVVQGGTFRNPAVHRAMELILGKKVICSDMPEIMGAYGAALTVKDENGQGGSTFIGLDDLDKATDMKSDYIRCNGCQNRCMVTRMRFANGEIFHTGNKCEKIFTNKGTGAERGTDLTEQKLKFLFDRDTKPRGRSRGRIGIPRVLNMFQNYPFWATLLRESGFEVVLSPPSDPKTAEIGSRTVMSENICFPAKIVNGHIKKLFDMDVDRIFFPLVVFEEEEFQGSLNSFNCPVVSGYPDVVRSAVDPEGKAGIPFDSPTVSFRERAVLRKGVRKYMRGLGVEKDVFSRAFKKALKEIEDYKENVKAEGQRIVEKAEGDGRLVVLLVGRPYHIDQMINHKISDMVTSLGADVITEDSVPEVRGGVTDVQVLTQWQYPNRVYNAVKWARGKDNVEVVQLNSFGCGPDAIVCDEARAILASAGKNHTLIRIDEVSSSGSIRLRLRSMKESLEKRGMGSRFRPIPRKTTPPFEHVDRGRKVIVPYFSRFVSPLIEGFFRSAGYDIETLPEPNRESVEVGLKYCNNEICYPAIIVIGDLIKALQSGRYDKDQVAVGITQTGGQCRASSYLSLLQKALVSAGFHDVPVVTLTLAKDQMNEQPGLKFDIIQVARTGVQAMLFADSIMQMYNATVCREKVKGQASMLADRYMDIARSCIRYRREGDLTSALKKAVEEFNAVETSHGDIPRIGFVGEIYVKYNPFGNFRVVDWMLDNGIEVIVPPIFDFFAQTYLNARFHVEGSTKKMTTSYFLSWPMEWYVRYHMKVFERIGKDFRFHRPSHYIGTISRRSSDLVSLVDQFGEGWLIPAEIGAFAEEGVNNVVCVQPFGCISNHIIGKGVEKGIKNKYPDMNVLYLDMDAGSSEVNLYNRLNFIVRSAREDLRSSSGAKIGSG